MTPNLPPRHQARNKIDGVDTGDVHYNLTAAHESESPNPMQLSGPNHTEIIGNES